jgi:hypothetical protein
MAETEKPQAQLFAALAQLQANLPKIAKDGEAKVEGSEGKRGYTYKYADLADVAEVVEPMLGKHGLAFTAKPTLVDGMFGLAYKLVHESGEFDDGFYPLPDPRNVKPQAVGSAITYARRYSLCAVTGVAPNGDDDDAATAQSEFQSAGAAFAAASPARPAPAAPARPASADQEWLADALKKASSGALDGEGCRSLWRESAEKVHAGLVVKEDAQRVQDKLRARLEELGREAKAEAGA